jgi:hypothetical protein
VKCKSLTATIALLAVGIAFSVWGDPTTLSMSNGSITLNSRLTHSFQGYHSVALRRRQAPVRQGESTSDLRAV